MYYIQTGKQPITTINILLRHMDKRKKQTTSHLDMASMKHYRAVVGSTPWLDKGQRCSWCESSLSQPLGFEILPAKGV
jgi:hypothetical protein